MGKLVQTVENTEYIDTVICRPVNEMTDYIFRIIRIAYRIGTAGQHLE